MTDPSSGLPATLRDLIARLDPGRALLAPTGDGFAGLTTAMLLSRMDTIGRMLAACGIRRTERVGIVLPNGPLMAVTFLGVAAHCAAAPLNPAYNEAELDFYFADLDIRAVVLQAGAESPARVIARRRGVVVLEADPVTAAGVVLSADESAGRAVHAASADAGDIALILHTSGTTARPKQVPLTHRNLLASARAVATTLQLGPDDIALNVMPLFHIHGLVGVLLASLQAGSAVICAPGFESAQFLQWLRSGAFTWYSAVPTIHQSVLEACPSPEAVAGHRLRFIRSSSSALAPVVMSRLEARFGVPVIEAYGMTEAAHQMASNPLPPADRKPGSVGRAAGPDIAIMDAAGQMLAAGQAGEVVIRGDNVMAGYVANPEANAAAFDHGWFHTGDQGYLDGDGYLYLTGRLKEIINRAGEKISPREVDEALLEHPAVSQAVTFAMPHPTIGEDVMAAVVCTPGVPVSEPQLREWLFERLAAMKVPSRIVLVDAIPKGPTGKVQRIGLHERLAARLAVEHVAAVTPTEVLLAGIWAELLAIPVPGTGDNFFALGGDSLRAVRVVARIRDAVGVEIEVTALFRQPTIAMLATLVDARVAQRDADLLAYVGSLSDAEVARLLERTDE